jgi:hypothetical protein
VLSSQRQKATLVSKPPIRVLIGDNHPLVREGLNAAGRNRGVNVFVDLSFSTHSHVHLRKLKPRVTNKRKDVMNNEVDYAKVNVARISEDGFAATKELKLIPRGTFAGTIYQLGLVHNGQAVASDTAEQGNGQN